MAKASSKRKREEAPTADPRLQDPYCLEMKACRLADHQQVKKKVKGGTTVVMIRNCEHNPNCVYGLGEFQKGVWQGNKVVRRLLGDDPRELLRGPYPSDHAAEAGRMMPCGLRNLGATCYLNSMLQVLFMTRPFRQAVYDWEPKESNVSEQQILQMRALQRLFAAMQLGKKNVYDPQEFASTLSLNSVLQQDAQEFSKLLLAHLRGIFTLSRVEDHAELVDRLFMGQMNYVTKCLRCQNKSSRPSSYYEISLNIKGHKTVEKCIESYLAAELLDGDNKYFCDNCNSKENAERFIEVEPEKLPPILSLQLMRFVYDAQAGRKKKLMDVIEVGETLNMTEILRRCGYAEAFEAPRDAVYRLTGYLNHRGKSAHVGHYTASVAHPSESSRDTNAVDWFEFDDNVVKNMTTVVDTEGVQEHHGKVIKSRDAYMLIYTRFDDPMLNVAHNKPSQICMDELNVWNADFADEVAQYQSKAEGLEKRIEERLEMYKRFFEKDVPTPAPNAKEYYWVDSNWLHSWVSGEDVPAPAKDSTNTARFPGDGSVEGVVDVDGAKTDGADSDDQKHRDEDMEGSAVDENIMQTVPVVDGNADSVPFKEPIDIGKYCCEHSSIERKVLRFSPESVKNLKRISSGLFSYLRQTCGIAFNGEPSLSASKEPLVFASASFRCMTCELTFREKLLQDADELSEVGAELALLKAPVMPGESPTYLMSRAWIASYKAQLTQSQKNLQRASKVNGKRPSNGIKSHFTTDLEAVTDSVEQRTLNEDITCPHGNLILDKKKYRPVPLDTWLHFSQKYPVVRVFKEGPEAQPCEMCTADRATTDEDAQRRRAARDEIVQRGPLSRLYKRRLHTQSGSFMLNEVFVPLNSSHASKRTCMFLVSSSWMRMWRSYVRDIDRSEPGELRSDDLTCDHGKLLIPRSLLQVVKGKSVQHSDMDVEFVYPDELMALGELYGMPESVYYYGELLPFGQMTWKSCTLQDLGVAMSVGLAVPADELNGSSVACVDCENTSEQHYQNALQNFENRVIHVQQLAEDQPVPSSITLADESSSGRRRSKRIKTGSGSTWPIAANADDTVYVLKTKIFEEIDVYPIRQRLYFRGNVLQDNKTLRDSGIKAGDAIYMRVSEDIPEELVIADEGQEREVGFEDSVFLSRRQPSAAPSQSSSSVWVCSACTFVNDAGDEACEMCSTAKAIEID